MLAYGMAFAWQYIKQTFVRNMWLCDCEQSQLIYKKICVETRLGINQTINGIGMFHGEQ